MSRFAMPDPDRPVPRECEWTQKGGDWAQRMACERPPTVRCSKQLREKWVCGIHAGSHKRLTPLAVRCGDHDHTRLFDRP